jgi:isocitrate/isopropylmalate dehydrogenase
VFLFSAHEQRGIGVLKIGILPGDDIGLEVVPECVKVMKAAAAKTGLEVAWQELPIGKRGHALHGNTLPPVTAQALETATAGLPALSGTPPIRATIRHG